MIKINLLDSVTERQAGAVVVVERKIANPASRLLVMIIAVAFLLTAGIAFDFITASRSRSQAEEALQVQKQKAIELEAILKEQRELEAKIKNIDIRINAIKKLRDSQAGPSAVLEAMRERIAMVPGLYLESVEQTGEQLTVRGNSPDESAVTQFGRSLEFSGGLFSNLNIETQRKEKPNQAATPANGADAPPKQEIVGFTIRCAYTPSKAKASQSTAATTASSNGIESPKPSGSVTLQEAVKQQLPKPAAQTDGTTTPPQVAKN
ncbi:MAG: PilN domain-containing protein [Pyrinomonadaceae bacterium]|nr:PilN domain-containing protein [Pyrinomonadaceae bacterium]